jgi:hypothetical protein
MSIAQNLLAACILVVAVLLYKQQDQLMEHWGLISPVQACLNAKVRLKRACCDGPWFGEYSILNVKDNYCTYVEKDSKSTFLGGCHPAATLTDEEYKQVLEMLWSTGACSTHGK